METLTTVAPELLEQVYDLKQGQYSECGVYWGGSAEQIRRAMPGNWTLYLLDSFEGLPEPCEYDDLARGCYKSSFEQVNQRFSSYPNVLVIKGWFKDTLPILSNQTFRFVHLDCDQYESYKECLKFFLPRMVKGGVVLLDDYTLHVGARRAVDELRNGRNLQMSSTERAWLNIQ